MSEAYRYVRLEQRDAVYFRGLDPYEKLGILSMPYGFGIGVLEDSEKALEPIGLMIGTASEERITIEWLVVEPGHQFEGIGEQLVVTVFEMAQGGSIPEVAAALSPEFEKEKLTGGARSYFEERLFTRAEELGPDGYYQLAELAMSKVAKAEVDEEAFKPLADMTSTQARDCLENLGLRDSALFTFSPEIVKNHLEADLSLVAMNGTKLEAALLVAKYEDLLCPVYYYAKSEDLGDAIIGAAIQTAIAKYGKGQDVLFMNRQPESIELVEKVAGPQERGALLFASVKEFENIEDIEE